VSEMKHSVINFPKISQALSGSIEAIKNEQGSSLEALNQLLNAQSELQQALSYSSSLRK
jgi:hypothetical protein